MEIYARGFRGNLLRNISFASNDEGRHHRFFIPKFWGVKPQKEVMCPPKLPGGATANNEQSGDDQNPCDKNGIPQNDADYENSDYDFDYSDDDSCLDLLGKYAKPELKEMTPEQKQEYRMQFEKAALERRLAQEQVSGKRHLKAFDEEEYRKIQHEKRMQRKKAYERRMKKQEEELKKLAEARKNRIKPAMVDVKPVGWSDVNIKVPITIPKEIEPEPEKQPDQTPGEDKEVPNTQQYLRSASNPNNKPYNRKNKNWQKEKNKNQNQFAREYRPNRQIILNSGNFTSFLPDEDPEFDRQPRRGKREPAFSALHFVLGDFQNTEKPPSQKKESKKPMAKLVVNGAIVSTPSEGKEIEDNNIEIEKKKRPERRIQKAEPIPKKGVYVPAQEQEKKETIKDDDDDEMPRYRKGHREVDFHAVEMTPEDLMRQKEARRADERKRQLEEEQRKRAEERKATEGAKKQSPREVNRRFGAYIPGPQREEATSGDAQSQSVPAQSEEGDGKERAATPEELKRLKRAEKRREQKRRRAAAKAKEAEAKTKEVEEKTKEAEERGNAEARRDEKPKPKIYQKPKDNKARYAPYVPAAAPKAEGASEAPRVEEQRPVAGAGEGQSAEAQSKEEPVQAQ